MPVAGTYIIVNLDSKFQPLSKSQREAEGPFKAKKDKKFMPAAGTYSIVNYVREGLRGPFKAKNFLPAAGTYIVVN